MWGVLCFSLYSNGTHVWLSTSKMQAPDILVHRPTGMIRSRIHSLCTRVWPRWQIGGTFKSENVNNYTVTELRWGRWWVIEGPPASGMQGSKSPPDILEGAGKRWSYDPRSIFCLVVSCYQYVGCFQRKYKIRKEGPSFVRSTRLCQRNNNSIAYCLKKKVHRDRDRDRDRGLLRLLVDLSLFSLPLLCPQYW